MQMLGAWENKMTTIRCLVVLVSRLGLPGGVVGLTGPWLSLRLPDLGAVGLLSSGDLYRFQANATIDRTLTGGDDKMGYAVLQLALSRGGRQGQGVCGDAH
jgi:hypothetical protein